MINLNKKLNNKYNRSQILINNNRKDKNKDLLNKN